MELTGARFSKWTVLGRAPRSEACNLARWHCRCDCGKESVVYQCNLTRKKKPSSDCGCGRREILKNQKYATKHGLCGTVEYKLFSSAFMRSKTKGLDFDLEFSDIVVPSHCPLLGIEIFEGKKHKSDNSPSLDRIDNSRGYIKGNVWVISDRANTLKNNASLEELELLVVNLRNKKVIDRT